MWLLWQHFREFKVAISGMFSLEILVFPVKKFVFLLFFAKKSRIATIVLSTLRKDSFWYKERFSRITTASFPTFAFIPAENSTETIEIFGKTVYPWQRMFSRIQSLTDLVHILKEIHKEKRFGNFQGSPLQPYEHTIDKVNFRHNIKH